jgi:hypothetical protein
MYHIIAYMLKMSSHNSNDICLLSKMKKIKVHRNIILPIILYGYEMAFNIKRRTLAEEV